jgi:hypothetical protein
MNTNAYRFTFHDDIPMTEVRDSILLAAIAAEGVHGRHQVRLDAGYWVDNDEHACVVDFATQVGRTVSLIFTTLVAREFGEDAFKVERIDAEESGFSPDETPGLGARLRSPSIYGRPHPYRDRTGAKL